MNRGMLTSNTAEWATPPETFAALDSEFGFTLDACATAENAKCARFFTREDDGLSMPWEGVVWCNAPYGRTVDRWVRKAYESSLGGATVVMLLPARVDTSWFHDICLKGDVRFLRGRQYFESPGKKRDRAPFPSMVVVFRPKREATEE